jgi:hypothetical protein
VHLIINLKKKDILINDMSKSKIKVNDKCLCASGKKYKKCCMNINKDIFFMGHKITSDNIQNIVDRLKEEYSDHSLIDISNLLTDTTYKEFQTKNYYEKTIMIAEKNDNNAAIMETRGILCDNIIIMYRGAYLCFEYEEFEDELIKIVSMINTRLDGKEL